MNLKQAQYLEAVCRTGSVTKAAAELYVSRTVISHSLRELEDEFSTVLFNRTRMGMELTEAGELLWEHCRQMRLADSAIRDRINALSFPDSQPQVKLAFTITAGVRLFPDFFTQMSAFDTIDAVCEGRVDFAITPVGLGDPQYQNIGRHFLHKLETVICVSKDHPLSREKYLTQELIGETPFVTPPYKNPLHFPINITMRINQIDLIHKIVASGIAATVINRDYVWNWDDVVTLPMKEPIISNVNLIWDKTVPHSNVFNQVLNFVRTYDISKLEDY